MMILKQVFFSGLLILLLFSCKTTSDKYLLFQKTEGTPKHPRGLAVHQSGLMVIAGHDGQVEIYDQLKVVKSFVIPEMEDIRDVEILNDNSIILMNSGNKGEIWRYFLKNDSLVNVYKADSVFLDGLSFWNNAAGMCFGDPTKDRLTILRTSDSSKTWTPLDYNLIPKGMEGEAGFAASGTGISTQGTETVFIGTGGGSEARLYVSSDQGLNWETKSTPMKSGGSFGIYAMYFWSETEGVIIGGSYEDSEYVDCICFSTSDGGDSWVKSNNGLKGYCSGISGTSSGDLIIATGRVGTYYTKDKGQNWKLFSEDKFYSVQVLDDKVYFSGKNGAIKVFNIQAFS